MTDRRRTPQRGCLAFLLLLASAGLGSAAFAQATEPDFSGATEDVVAGATIVRGQYTAGGLRAEWEAAVRDGQPERIVEWRTYGESGQGNVVFSFHDGSLMHYAEQSERREGAGSGYRRVELSLSFNDGRYSGGRKSVDGTTGRPDPQDIETARAQAQAALDRVAVTKPAWQDRHQRGDSSFSVLQTPVPDSPTSQAQRMAGPGEQMVFRCDDNLFAILGANADTLVVAPPGRDPVVLPRQPRGAMFHYLGSGWGAQRSGDEMRLQDASGRAILCRHGN